MRRTAGAAGVAQTRIPQGLRRVQGGWRESGADDGDAARGGRSDHAPTARCRGHRDRGLGAACADRRKPGRAGRRLCSCHEVPRATRGTRIRIIAITCLPWPRFRAAHARLHPRVRRFLRGYDNDVKSWQENLSGSGFATKNRYWIPERMLRRGRNAWLSSGCASGRAGSRSCTDENAVRLCGIAQNWSRCHNWCVIGIVTTMRGKCRAGNILSAHVIDK